MASPAMQINPTKAHGGVRKMAPPTTTGTGPAAAGPAGGDGGVTAFHDGGGVS